VLLVLGWAGGVTFLLSAVGALWMSLRAVLRWRTGIGYLAAATALLVQVIGGTIFAGVGGAMFWLAVAMAMTASAAQGAPHLAPLASGASR
jgi:hypothetical protein